MDVAKALKGAPNQKSVLTCLQDNHLGKWVRAHQVAEELNLNADQVRRAANVLHGKDYLEKKSEDTYCLVSAFMSVKRFLIPSQSKSWYEVHPEEAVCSIGNLPDGHCDTARLT